jgi:SAM-dependent MidA family methyltransferase
VDVLKVGEFKSETLNAQCQHSNIQFGTEQLNVERQTLRVERLNMRSGNPALIKLIRAEIQKRGPVSFAWFMEQALYHPEHGYYSSGQCAIGRYGDYFTNVSVGPLFGRLLTTQFAEMWERLGENFVIVEQGAHHGDFARDVLESAAKYRPDFFAALQYRIVEPFPILQDRQSRTLAEFEDKIEWRASIESLDPFTGVHFSNELLDSMPVRLIGQSKEKLVDLEGDGFVLIERALSNGATACRPPRKKGAFNQPALDWIDNVGAKLRRGYVLAVDYGHLSNEFDASIQVRSQHRHLDSPFERIGHADITMHVDWMSVAERGRATGLHVAGFTDQHHFLTGILSEWPEIIQSRLLDVDSKMKRELQTLLHPEMLGRSFQALALAKNVDPDALRLASFKFAGQLPSALDF